MATEKNNLVALKLTAWDIAYEIMTRSVRPLLLTVLHPGDGQYSCVTILKDASLDCCKTFINLHDTSISAGDELIQHYQELYKKNKARLINEISQLCRYSLAHEPIREMPALAFLKRLVHEFNDDSRLIVTSAWYDGVSCGLSDYAKSFAAYKYKNADDRLKHLLWWVITCSQKTPAMCNLETDELLMRSG